MPQYEIDIGAGDDFVIKGGSGELARISSAGAPSGAFAGGADYSLPGIITPTFPGWAFGIVTGIANRAFANRFILPRPMNITLAAFGVNVAATTDDPCDVGIYDALGNKIVSSGATSGKMNVTAVSTIPLVATLKAGTVYYSAIAYGPVGGVAAQFMAANFGALYMARLFGAAAPLGVSMFKDAAYPLPATLAGFSVGASTNGTIALRES